MQAQALKEKEALARERSETSAKEQTKAPAREQLKTFAKEQTEAPAREHFMPKARLTKEFGKTKLPFGGDSDDDDDRSVQSHMEGKSQPFKVEARVDIPTFDGSVDAAKVDAWIDQLETYFSLYGFNSQEKVSFARLKLTSHALAWEEFTRLLRQEYYPMGPMGTMAQSATTSRADRARLYHRIQAAGGHVGHCTWQRGCAH